MADKKVQDLSDLLVVDDNTLLYAVREGEDFKTTPGFLARNSLDVATKGYLKYSFSLPLIESGTIDISKVVTELVAPGAIFTLPVAAKGVLKILVEKSGGTTTVNTIGLGFTTITLTGPASVTLVSDGTQWIATALVSSALS